MDMATGLRRGELTGIKWGDIDFANLLIDVQRSVVDQVVPVEPDDFSPKASGLMGDNRKVRPATNKIPEH
jgi:integrase